MSKRKISPKLISVVLGALVSIFLVSFYIFAWREPTAPPPGDNVPAPLHTGVEGQLKAGGLILNTGGAPIGLIVQTGNVGIGTTTPAFKLEVVGDVGANAFYYRSDINFKKDIERLNIKDVLAKISQLQAVRYSLKENKESQKQIGFLVQEVEKVFPEIVIEKNKEKLIDLKGLVTILLEAIKEQEKEIEILKTKIQELELKIK